MTRDRSKLGRAIAEVEAQIAGLTLFRDKLLEIQRGSEPHAPGPLSYRKPRRTKAEMQAARDVALMAETG